MVTSLEEAETSWVGEMESVADLNTPWVHYEHYVEIKDDIFMFLIYA